MNFAQNLLLICFGAAFLGIGIGVVDATVNAFAGQYYDAKFISWMHAIYGVGGVISSLIY